MGQVVKTMFFELSVNWQRDPCDIKLCYVTARASGL